MKNEKIIIAFLNARIKIGEEAKQNFIKKFNQYPLSAFEWQEVDIEKIAYGELCLRIKIDIEENLVYIDKIIEHFTNECVLRSQWRNNTTSVSANLVNDIKETCIGKFLNEIKYIV